MKSTTVFSATLLDLPVISQEKGNITAINGGIELPFDISRVYYLYDVPGGASRGGHAHIELQQLIVAASGSFDIILNDGHVKRTFTLNRPDKGLFMPSGLWRELDNFSSGAICLVLASDKYTEGDYIRDLSDFKEWKSN